MQRGGLGGVEADRAGGSAGPPRPTPRGRPAPRAVKSIGHPYKIRARNKLFLHLVGTTATRYSCNSPTSHTEETPVNDKEIEQEIQAKGLTAPRVTPADIEANIASEHYFTASDGVTGASDGRVGYGPGSPLSLLTFCVLVLKNGFTVTGESACASPENFNADLGKKIARDAAVNKVWPLMGYHLKCQLQADQQ